MEMRDRKDKRVSLFRWILTPSPSKDKTYVTLIRWLWSDTESNTIVLNKGIGLISPQSFTIKYCKLCQLPEAQQLIQSGCDPANPSPCRTRELLVQLFPSQNHNSNKTHPTLATRSICVPIVASEHKVPARHCPAIYATPLRYSRPGKTLNSGGLNLGYTSAGRGRRSSGIILDRVRLVLPVSPCTA